VTLEDWIGLRLLCMFGITAVVYIVGPLGKARRSNNLEAAQRLPSLRLLVTPLPLLTGTCRTIGPRVQTFALLLSFTNILVAIL
jgi:hypothetical protein